MSRPFAVLALFLAAACGGNSSPPAPTPEPTGSLQVDISGVPASAGAPVDVTGPKGSVRVASGTTLTGLAPGDYAVTAGEVAVGGKTYAGTVSGSPAHVQANATAKASVAYAEVPGAPAPGTLQVEVSGLPAGIAAQVSVTGPGGFARDLTEGAVLEGLPPGSYAVAAAQASVPGIHVRTLFDAKVDAPTVQVASGASARVKVKYATLPGSGNLWGRGASAVGAYDDRALEYGASAPTSAVGAGDIFRVAVDRAGNLFATTSGANGLEFFPAASLGSGASLPAWSFSPSGGALDLALDGAGGVWVSNVNAGELSHFPASQLGTASPAADVTLTLSEVAKALAFDAAGNLWAALDTSLIELTPAQLAASGSPTPTVTLSGAAIVSGQHAMAFDSGGALWLANGNAGTIVAIRPKDLATSSASVGYRELLFAVGSVVFPYALAFDESGDLWVSDVGAPTRVVAFSPGQLWSGYLTTPEHSVTDGVQPGGLAFDPPPANLPLAR